MDQPDISDILNWHSKNKEPALFGRRIIFDMIAPILKSLPNSYHIDQIGESFGKIPIYKVSIGEGKTKVLLWSQMHGNESTGTKAMFDLFQFFGNTHKISALANAILKECTLVFIPLLNPDGAIVYTRKNGQDIDLNRDAVALKAPESVILNKVLKEFNPQFCFNLHDQRTIFSVGVDRKPATISFLAPSEDEARTVTNSRKITMSVIAAMESMLQKLIPNQVGRYTDEFYPTATGDNFQKAGHHTILIEAGHFKDDYDREEVRKFNFVAMIVGLQHISLGNYTIYEPYFSIPNNEKQYLDLIYKNVFLSENNQNVDVGIIFKETLIENKVILKPSIEYVKDLSDYSANSYIDKMGKTFKNKDALGSLIEN